MNNKEFSNRQEKMVADYMGWKVVSGSGARPFAPGDVANSQWLVECKTHNTEQENVVFRKTHWKKISEEARSVNKYSILITDNGTQKLQNTWVMVSRRLVPEDNAFRIFGLVNSARSDSTVTFNHTAAVSLYKSGLSNKKINYFPEWCNGEQVAIMPLEEFKKFYKEQFES